ncbi:STAS domain-containing protein [Desulfohalobiaceae bacterium Ax17]|uniref:STAS domain-containing protein n=1 Tax=Desulfovulcanus ferrireducens TaxID=2831190 RepID=UPI00207BCB57|nr:STAS domain-containing protein [Desulfovulcanus ferrireducens]MBT8763880.1 STAS domain-containing protein [Desulfovulcanus ferrireducens]
MCKFKIIDEGDRVYLKFKGDLTIEHGEKIKEALNQVLTQGKDIFVDLDDMIKVDLCFIQALLAAQKSAWNSQLSFMVSENEVLKKYAQSLGCMLKKMKVFSPEVLKLVKNKTNIKEL